RSGGGLGSRGRNSDRMRLFCGWSFNPCHVERRLLESPDMCKGVGALRLRLSLPLGAASSAQGDTRIKAVTLVMLVLVVASAFGQGTRGTARKSGESRALKPKVILITIDTLRADHVGCYGARDVKTPTLDGLAHDGVVFERAISQIPLTWPSHAVILTGTYPFQNGVQDFTGHPLGQQFRSVAQAFKQAGYA